MQRQSYNLLAVHHWCLKVETKEGTHLVQGDSRGLHHSPAGRPVRQWPRDHAAHPQADGALSARQAVVAGHAAIWGRWQEL